MVKSAFCGVIDEIPGISVDNFERADEIQARAYFLSHCHSDHTQGLFTPVLIRELERSGACIYMSRSTAAIIEDESVDDQLVKFIRPLDLGHTSIILPKVPSQNLPELFLNVTLLPAGHSFGSVMFLFQTETKNVLFTGDFRVSVNGVAQFAKLHDKTGCPIILDALYVDTTFLGYQYENFPKRTESVDYMVEEIQKWFSADTNNMVALHTSAKYGYEFVFNEIFERLKEKVYVGKDRWTLYSKFQSSVPGVTNEETKIHICRNNTESKTHEKCIKNHINKNFLFIHFSAMKWSNYQCDSKCINKVNNKRIDVCFATHCSKTELENFINYYNPKKIIGFPEEYVQNEGKKRKVEEVTYKSPKKVSKCNEIKKFKKVDKSVLVKMFGPL